MYNLSIYLNYSVANLSELFSLCMYMYIMYIYLIDFLIKLTEMESLL